MIKPMPIEQLLAFREKEKLRYAKMDVSKSADRSPPGARSSHVVVAVRDEFGRLAGLTMGERVEVSKTGKVDPDAIFDELFAPFCRAADSAPVVEVQKSADDPKVIDLTFFPPWLR
jgi:hypothetical protein